MKKALLIFITLTMLLAFAACSEETVRPETPDFNVEATATAADAGMTAADLLIAAMDAQELTYTIDNGYFDNIGGYASTDSEGWLFYYNDELAPVGAKAITLAEGDTMAFRWESYTAFDDSLTDDQTADDTATAQ